jgi:putative transposase
MSANLTFLDSMYRWRKLSAAEQDALVNWRRKLQRPWHSPPHFETGSGRFHLTAACFEHVAIVGQSLGRMASFVEELLPALDNAQAKVHAWCLLPNHYHLLLEVADLTNVLAAIGRVHGRNAYFWNGEDDQRGRKVWCAPADRLIRGEAHFWATLNYIHHNPVKHGWVEKWTDWPFSSAADYLATVGREEALRCWRSYPVLDYGKGWDD